MAESLSLVLPVKTLSCRSIGYARVALRAQGERSVTNSRDVSWGRTPRTTCLTSTVLGQAHASERTRHAFVCPLPTSFFLTKSCTGQFKSQDSLRVIPSRRGPLRGPYRTRDFCKLRQRLARRIRRDYSARSLVTIELRLEQCKLRHPCTDKLDQFYDAMNMLAYRTFTLQRNLLCTAER